MLDPFPLRGELLLRCRGSLNEPPNCVRDSERGLQDQVVHLHLNSAVPRVLWLGHELLQLLCSSLDRPPSAQHPLLDDIPIRPRKVAPLVLLFATSDSTDSEGLLRAPRESMSTRSGTSFRAVGWREVELIRLQVEEAPQANVSSHHRHGDEHIRRLVVLSELGDALEPGEDVGEGLSELVGAFDHIDMITALFAFEGEVEGRCRLGGVVHSFFDHRERVFWRRVEVAGLCWRFQLIDGVIDFLNVRLENLI